MATANTCVPRTLEGVIRGTNFTISGMDGTAQAGLVQQFNLEFKRNLSRVYDLASPSFYYIEGPAEGTVSFTKVVGPKGAPKLDCSCEARDIILDTGPMLCQTQGGGPLGAGGTFQYILKNAMPFGLNGQGSADNFLIIFGVSYLFNDIQ
jgi:hypothetical protein